MKLKLYSSLENKEWLIDIRDAGSSINFYHFKINLPNDMKDGQYEYELINNEKVIGKGLIQIGEFQERIIKYNNKQENIIYNG